MRMKRWILPGLVCAAINLPAIPTVHTQGNGPVPAVLARSDGSAWLWTGPDAEPQRLPDLADVEAAGLLGGEALLARGGGAPWTWNPEAAPAMARLACSRQEPRG